MELDLSNDFNFAPLPALQAGDLNLVITANPKPLRGIAYVPLFTYESLLAISNNHPLIKKTHLEPQDLTNQTLICYPVERDMLDIFTHFLEPAALRRASLTIMMMQLEASDRGVCAMPNWALEEYRSQQYVSTKHLGSEGIWYTLYAAIRRDQRHAVFMVDFLATTHNTSFHNLKGIRLAHQGEEELFKPH